MIVSLLLGALPPPSQATIEAYAAAKERPTVYPRYVYRVWSADWCVSCKSPAWQETLTRLDAIPGVGIQRCDYDRFRAYAARNGITALPAIQLYQVRGGKFRRLLATRIGIASYDRLRKLIPQKREPRQQQLPGPGREDNTSPQEVSRK